MRDFPTFACTVLMFHGTDLLCIEASHDVTETVMMAALLTSRRSIACVLKCTLNRRLKINRVISRPVIPTSE